tara:strand:+ start:138 stop:935 length:798 start_codon:yes stop_codon:yes gene_type:complete
MIGDKKELINFYNKNGYLIFKLFSKNEINYFEKLIKIKANKYLKKKNWKLQDYHKFTNQSVHKKVIENTARFINVKKSIIKKIQNQKIINDILKLRWKHSKFYIPNLKYLHGTEKETTLKKINRNEILYRIVLPKKLHYAKSAPPHVDLNAGKINKRIDKNFIPMSFSLWVPIVGFSKKYTLRVAPGSHLVKHPLKKIKKQSKYVSPVFENNYIKKFKFKRFNLKKGEVIFFDLNLLHGGADNLGKRTRSSLEIRLYNQGEIKFS